MNFYGSTCGEGLFGVILACLGKIILYCFGSKNLLEMSSIVFSVFCSKNY